MTVTIEDAKIQLGELIAKVATGETVVITRDEIPVARLVSVQPPLQPRVPGSAKDMIVFLADDFDAPLDDFKEYME